MPTPLHFLIFNYSFRLEGHHKCLAVISKKPTSSYTSIGIVCLEMEIQIFHSVFFIYLRTDWHAYKIPYILDSDWCCWSWVHCSCSLVVLRADVWEVGRTNYIPRFSLEGLGLVGSGRWGTSPRSCLCPTEAPWASCVGATEPRFVRLTTPYLGGTPQSQQQQFAATAAAAVVASATSTSAAPSPPLQQHTLDPACVLITKIYLLSQVVVLRDVTEHINIEGGV